MNLLEDILVLDFSQFLSGPSASLRLADMGARVIKIEKPGEGDICRDLYVSDVDIEGESTIFHAINRHKESYVAVVIKTSQYLKLKIEYAFKHAHLDQRRSVFYTALVQCSQNPLNGVSTC